MYGKNHTDKSKTIMSDAKKGKLLGIFVINSKNSKNPIKNARKWT